MLHLNLGTANGGAEGSRQTEALHQCWTVGAQGSLRSAIPLGWRLTLSLSPGWSLESKMSNVEKSSRALHKPVRRALLSSFYSASAGSFLMMSDVASSVPPEFYRCFFAVMYLVVDTLG